MPPSAMIGVPCRVANLRQSRMAVIWGTPTPATILVVQIDPGPTPTLTASTPALMSAWAPSAVATLPAISSHLKFFLVSLMASMTLFEWPWEVSMTMTSQPALSRT